MLQGTANAKNGNELTVSSEGLRNGGIANASTLCREISCDALLKALLANSSDSKPLLAKDPIDAITSACLAEGALFRDSTFPPEPKSINKQGEAELPVGQFLRFSTYRSAACIFSDDFGADLRQGALGNCYLMSLLADIAIKRPEILIECFSGRSQKSAAGCYSIKFFDRRVKEWRYVIVDDYFPTYVGELGIKPQFGKSRHLDEMWCSLLEKALAKLAGAYSSIDANTKVMSTLIDSNGSKAILTLLTGFETAYDVCFYSIEENMLWEKVLAFLKNRWFMTASSKGHSIDEADATGIAHFHDYSVVGATVIDGERLLRVRNPWAAKGSEWNGPWSDGDTVRWTEKKQALVAQDPLAGGPLNFDINDGLCFVPMDTFLTKFHRMSFFPIASDPAWISEQNTWIDAANAQAKKAHAIEFYFEVPTSILNQRFELASAPWSEKENGRPHYVSKNQLHLCFGLDQTWRIQRESEFCNKSEVMYCYSQTTDGCIPEGENQWSYWDAQKNDWIKATVSIKIWDDEAREALLAQAECQLELTGFSDQRFNGIYLRATIDPIFNDYPRFTHISEKSSIAVFDGQWRLQYGFEPKSDVHWAWIQAGGILPEGAHTWNFWNEKEKMFDPSRITVIREKRK